MAISMREFINKLFILAFLLYALGCEEEDTCHLCITTYSVEGDEQRRNTEILCDIDFGTVEQMEDLSSYQDGKFTVATWCRRYEHTEPGEY